MGNCVTSTRTAHVKPAREPTAGKGRRRIKLQDLPEVSLNLTSTRTAHVKPAREPTAGKGRRRIKIQDLPEDVLCEILSKLPVEEVVRTSVLSSEWRCLWTGCPKLTFKSRTMCSCGEEHDTQMFVDSVNAVLRQHSGKGVEGLEVKCLFENKLVGHLNNLISFAMSSRTKNLALDFTPLCNMGYNDPYVLPSELFDKESASCLECLQLRFVCLKRPSQFLGFSILRELELDMCKTTRKDLEDMLCSCCNLECLSMVRCRLQDELTVLRPLPHLQYLRIIHCFITKIEFHAAKLSTFVYNGPCRLIALHRASKLENAQVRFFDACSQQAVTTVLNGIPEVQHLTLEFAVEGKPQWMLGSPHMFSRLRHVQLLVKLFSQENDMLLCLLSFLSVAPVIEKLEVHFEDFLGVWFAHSESFRREVPSCQYKHLKSMYVSGFTAGRDQVEFVTHVAENASAIEVVTIDTAQHHIGLLCPEIKPADRRSALDVVRGPLLEKLPADAKLFLR